MPPYKVSLLISIAENAVDIHNAWGENLVCRSPHSHPRHSSHIDGWDEEGPHQRKPSQRLCMLENLQGWKKLGLMVCVADLCLRG